MKRLLAYLAAISIVALVASCLNTLEPGVSVETEEGEVLDITNDEAIATARAHYERYKQTSRVVCGEGVDQPMWPWQAKPHAPYDLGEYEIVWSSGYTKYYSGKVLTDFDIIKEHDFVFFPDTSDHRSGIKLRSRFVSVQSPDTTIQYIATYIPHKAYYDRYYKVRHGGGRVGLKEVNFSGWVLYTTLDGYHYAAYCVWQGDVISESNLYANFPSKDWSYEHFFSIMQDLNIGVCKLSEEVTDTSTLTEDDIASIVLIEEISIVAPKPKLRVVHYGTIYKYTPDWSTVSSYTKFYKHPGTGGGGGGGATVETLPDSGATPPNVTTPSIDGRTPEEVSEDIFNNYGNLADSVKTKVNTMIAEIAENCMGKQVLSRVISDNICVGFSLSSTGNSKYKLESNIIQMANFHSEELLHELFHALQLEIKAHNSVSAMDEKEVNYEIEAYVATYAYMRRSRVEDVLDRKDILDGSTFWNYIKDIESALDNNTSLPDNSVISLFVKDLIEDAAWYYIDHKPLDAKYYDRTISSGNNLSLILQITDC